MSSTMYHVTPRELIQLVPIELEAGNVPFIRSHPGEGKTAVTNAIAAALDLCPIIVILNIRDVADIAGLPHEKDGKATHLPFDLIPTKDTPLPINPFTGQPYKGWLVFFDEFNTSRREMQAASYQVIHERMVGQHPVHEKALMVCAGNEDNSQAIVIPQSSALRSRVVHFHMHLDHAEFLEDVALPQNWDPAIIAWIQWRKLAGLTDFTESQDQDTFCAPRTWEMNNRRMKVLRRRWEVQHGKDNAHLFQISETEAKAFAGTITKEVATTFVTFVNQLSELNILDTILAKPDLAPIPQDHGMCYFIATMLGGMADAGNMENLTKYMRRMSGLELQQAFGAVVIITNPHLRHNDHLTDYMSEVNSRSR